jgi:ABC-type dipeptide/oligopeptide/nickel transport system permease subunit
MNGERGKKLSSAGKPLGRADRMKNRLSRILRDLIRRAEKLEAYKAQLWLGLWVGGLLLVWFWDFLFLNAPEREMLQIAFGNSMFIASVVAIWTMALGWLLAFALEFWEVREKTFLKTAGQFGLNLIRSLPQIVGVLLGYVWITYLMDRGSLSGSGSAMLWMAFFLSLFILPEVVDMLRERIRHFRQSDFYNAMRVLGIAEWRIINDDILWKNSRIHLLNKTIAVFASAIFLQCSVDFIISVGLSTRVSTLNLPTTLGSLLANIDSKQDILAIGYSLTHPWYFPNLFFVHLQGISVAFVIIFTLFALFKMTNALAERFHL